MERFEHSSVLRGIGMSQVGRRLMRDPMSLVHEACMAAIADAGLEVSDIDGVTTSPGAISGPPTGYTFGGAFDVVELLGLTPNWVYGAAEAPGHSGPLVDAMLAVAAGLARHVLTVRGTWESSHTALLRSGRASPPTPAGRLSGRAAWHAPFGAMSPANWIAMQATNHMSTYGTTREQLGAIALNARANAANNPWSIYREPLSMADYLDARIVSTPFGLYDCDVPCDGAVAIIVSHADSAADGLHPAVGIEAIGSAIRERISWDQGDMSHEPLQQGAADHLWERSDLRQDDVDVAQIYDGFTFNCLSWIESLGFCEVGEGGPFVEGGTRIALDGELPLNTDGGQLSAGRLHGYGLIQEAIIQLRGDAGGRQVPGAEVAVVATGGGAPGGTMLLTRTR